MQHDAAGLTRRIRRLERVRAVLGGTVVLLAGLLLIAARPDDHTQDTLRVRRLQLTDHTGRVRMDLRHDSTDTGLFILDDAGDTRIGVAQFAHGGGGVALHGPGAKGAVVLYLKESGSLSVYDASGVVIARFPDETEHEPSR